MRNELRTRSENRWRAAQPFILDMLFPNDHPYSQAVIGTHESLDAMSLESARAFAKQGYSSENSTMVVSGDIDRADVPELLFANTELSFFHPDLTPEMVRKWPVAGVESADPNNIEHWIVWPADPNDPERQLPLRPARRRGAAEAPEPPPPVRAAPESHLASVDRPLTVVAWSLPGTTGLGEHPI